MSRKIIFLALVFTYLLFFSYWVNMLEIKKEIDPELSKYYNVFEKSVQLNCYSREYEEPNQIIVQFTKSESNYGSCSYNLVKYTIDISRKLWDSLDESGKFQLMFHESAHCFFREEHVEDIKNIMNSVLYDMPMGDIISQTENIIKKNCTLWRQYGFNPIKTGN